MRSSDPGAAGSSSADSAQISPRSRVGGWAIAAVLAVVALLLYEIRVALLPFVFAIAVAFVTDPLVVAGQKRWGLRRWVVASLVYLVFLLALGGAGYVLVGSAVRDLVHLVGQAPEIAQHLLQEIVGERGITLLGKTYTPEGLVTAVAAAVKGAIGFTIVAKAGQIVIGAVFGLVLALVLMPFLMISGPRLAAGAIWLIPPERRASVTALLPKLLPVLRRYLVGIAVVVAYTVTAAWIGFGLLAGLPSAPLLSIAVGVLEIVPVVGPTASMIIVGLTAVQQSTLSAAILLMAFVVGLRLSIDNLVGPLVLGQATRLHPVIIIASFLCGAILFGIVGLLLAVPAAVCLKLTLEHYYAEPIRREEAEEAG